MLLPQPAHVVASLSSSAGRAPTRRHCCTAAGIGFAGPADPMTEGDLSGFGEGRRRGDSRRACAEVQGNAGQSVARSHSTRVPPPLAPHREGRFPRGRDRGLWPRQWVFATLKSENAEIFSPGQEPRKGIDSATTCQPLFTVSPFEGCQSHPSPYPNWSRAEIQPAGPKCSRFTVPALESWPLLRFITPTTANEFPLLISAERQILSSPFAAVSLSIFRSPRRHPVCFTPF